MKGVVESIHIGEAGGASMTEIAKAQLVAGRGIVGKELTIGTVKVRRIRVLL